MYPQVKSVRRVHQKLLDLRLLVFIGFVWIASSAFAIGQADSAPQCMRTRLTGSATVRGFIFRTYEATNPDADSGCLQIYRNGKVVYRLAGEEQEYDLGQPGNAQYKIPHIPNGTDLTGDGQPEMIVTAWSGGAHCCYKHYIFELQPKLRLLTTIEDGDTDLAHFEKMNLDRGYFYATYDLWSYWPSSFVSSVSHKVLLRWDGKKFRLDLNSMRHPPPTDRQWKAAFKDVDDALKDSGDTRGVLGLTLWDTVLDLLYTGHSDLAWKFVREVNSNALKGDNPSLGEFCSALKSDPYWPDLEPTLRNVPEQCVRARPKTRD